ncbi:mannose-P-dolichol utilization defect 1 protein homolog [Planococcus citri]|uniref:mannose-P-dolichol utilization defect 1 protein homolog n=1 Tax=Planococcus citri TaxID=170843 RepID=UPI0031F98F61
MAVALAEYFKNLLLFVFTPECYDTVFVQQDFFDVPCLKSAVSKCLGYGIIAGSVLVKVPQIVKISKNKSAEGISIVGQILELYGVTASVAYSYVKRFPFSSWGDSVFMLAQTSTIAGLSLHFNKGNLPCFVFLIVYSILVYLSVSGFVAVHILWFFQASSVPVMFIGKMIQVYRNFQAKSMGQLSLITNALLFFGSLARVFTSVQETGDFIIILTYSLATFANGIMLTQFFVYPSSDAVKKPARKKQQKPQPPPKKKKQR